jgi:CRP-like cAMP-binding protein
MILLAFTHARYWRARVCKDGKELRQMGAGESFGEIALLRPVPRTATVIVMSACRPEL